MYEDYCSHSERHSSDSSVGEESDSSNHSSSSDYDVDPVDGESETSYSSEDEDMAAASLRDEASAAEPKGGEDGDEKFQNFLSRMRTHYKTNHRLENKEAKRDFYLKRLDESASTPTRTASAHSEGSSEESVSSIGGSEPEEQEEETESNPQWPIALLASATSCISTSSPSMIVLRAVATGAAGLLGSVGAVGLAHRLEVMSTAPPISEDNNNDDDDDSDGIEEDYVNLQRRSNLGMLSVRLFGRILSVLSLEDAASMGASCAAYQGLVATHDIWKAAFERCFSGRLSILEEEASSRFTQPQWRRLFLQRAVIAYAHVGTLDDDDEVDEAASIAAVTHAPKKGIVDALNCLQVANQVPPEGQGSVLHVSATGWPRSCLAPALNALKAAALAATPQTGTIDQEDDSKVVEKDRKHYDQGRADDCCVKHACSFPLPHFEGSNITSTFGSATVFEMETEPSDGRSRSDFHAPLLPHHAAAVLLVVDPAAPPSELRTIANWIHASFFPVIRGHASKVAEYAKAGTTLDQTNPSTPGADSTGFNRALLILATYPSSSSVTICTVADPAEVTTRVSMPPDLPQGDASMPLYYRTPRELALALQLHDLCGREWTHSDVLQKLPHDRLAAAKCAATGSVNGGGRSGGMPWKLQPWTLPVNNLSGKARGLESALRFLAEVPVRRMRFRSSPVTNSEDTSRTLSETGSVKSMST